jgi:hypothetical protein
MRKYCDQYSRVYQSQVEPAESEYSTSKIRGPSDGLQNTNGDCFENSSNDVDHI